MGDETPSLESAFQNLQDDMNAHIQARYCNYLCDFQQMNAASDISIDQIRMVKAMISKMCFRYYDAANIASIMKFSEFSKMAADFFYLRYLSNHARKLRLLQGIVYNTRAVAVIISDYSRRYLLLEECGYLCGKYCFVKGAIEFGESPKDAGEREVYEELGVQVDLQQPFVQHCSEGAVQGYAVDSGSQILYVYYAELAMDTAFEPLSRDEVSGVVFVPVDDLRAGGGDYQDKMAQPWDNAELVGRVMDHFRL